METEDIQPAEEIKAHIPTVLVSLGLMSILGLFGEDIRLRAAGVPLFLLGLYLGLKSMKDSLQETLNVEEEQAAIDSSEQESVHEDNLDPEQ